ncbi:MAG TPA: AbrB/MazE/SpoVT family DNA-binding domain-containing protein [Thermoplasmatales archaeon]|nr:AbrB/MazE/SpoVT family DNA-binding domain-containing protein [Thermoplasmatales archaeon]
MQIAITRMSSKGQIVIPAEIRKGIEVGEEFVIIKNENRFILKRVKDIDENFRDDLEFAKRTEDAWKKYEKGEFKETDGEEFLKSLATQENKR